VSLAFDATTHTYRVGQRVLPSVTDVIKSSGLLKGLDHVNPGVRDRAAGVGKEVHEAIHRVSCGKPPGKVSAKAQPFLDGWFQFVEQNAPYKTEHSELKLYCDEYWFAGTIDQVGVLHGRRAIIDMKATTGFNATHVSWQTAAYQHMFNRYYPETPATHRYGLHLKPGTYSLWRFDSHMDMARFIIARRKLG
jgi:hypothetical protein